MKPNASTLKAARFQQLAKPHTWHTRTFYRTTIYLFI